MRQCAKFDRRRPLVGLTARSAERKAWSLADTLLGGDRAAAARAYLELRAQGERLPGLLYWVSCE